jgi:4-phosphopantoate---beta-alanine ligase
LIHKFEIPDSHPRAESLRLRERLIRAWEMGIVADAGLMAHGRGETFDYLIGETTIAPARTASHAAAAMLLNSKSPVISVNGNAAALASKELVELAEEIGAKLEVNLFYYSKERAIKIADLLRKYGAEEVFGVESKDSQTIPGLESNRRRVDRNGIFQADTVFVPLEDGDRTQALRNLGKQVIAIDLNPLSRTARSASITIIDNIVRAVPLLISECQNLSGSSDSELQSIMLNYSNQSNLKEAVSFILDRFENLSTKEASLEAS